MKRPTFFHGVGVALLLAFCASATIAALTPFVGFAVVLRLLIPLLCLGYVMYLLGRSNERVGRVSTLVSWVAVALLTWWFAPPLPLYLLIHVAAIWLVRSLYFYSGVLPVIADLGLGLAGIAAAAWAIGLSGSVFLAVWCFFLVQALFVAIPASMKSIGKSTRLRTCDNQEFDKARRQADRALNALMQE